MPGFKTLNERRFRPSEADRHRVKPRRPPKPNRPGHGGHGHDTHHGHHGGHGYPPYAFPYYWGYLGLRLYEDSFYWYRPRYIYYPPYPRTYVEVPEPIYRDHGPVPSPEVGGNVGRLVVKATPPDAAVYLDSHFLGVAGELAGIAEGLLLDPGDHVVELVHPGYETARLSLTITRGERTRVELAMRPVEPPGPSD